MQSFALLKSPFSKVLKVGVVLILATFMASWLLPITPLSVLAWLWVETITLAFVGMLLSILFGEQWPLLAGKHKATLLLLLIGSAVFALLGDMAFFTGATLAVVYPNLAVWALGTTMVLLSAIWLAHSFLEAAGYAAWVPLFIVVLSISLTLTLVVFFRLF